MARLLGFFLALGCAAAAAAPNEIKVFTDELARYREHTLETHASKADTGPWRVMPEYSYGIWHDWEFSLQVPFAFGSGPTVSEGYRVELQYIAPHDEERGLYWGINMELARVARRDEPELWSVEVIPIVGWRGGRWHLAANPGFERSVSGVDRSTTATPAAKVAYRAWGRNDFGIEYYRDAAESHTLYVAWDGKIGKSDINVGLGRGSGSGADAWVVKAIYEFAF
ncbi:MAG TPA: hypothetical protein VL199_16160 [Burkholderiales bacterium]|jgi:hypothetical protein|nr:hypothetical protein [Burkholderiales bacterium]